MSTTVVIGEVVEIRANKGFVDLTEATLLERQIGETTDLDFLTDAELEEALTMAEQGAELPPIEVAFDDPVASWRTVELVISFESQITEEGLEVGEGQLLAGMSISPEIGIDDLAGYRALGRSVWFLNPSPVFQGQIGLMVEGALVATLADDGTIVAFPLLPPAMANRMLLDEPSINSLIRATER